MVWNKNNITRSLIAVFLTLSLAVPSTSQEPVTTVIAVVGAVKTLVSLFSTSGVSDDQIASALQNIYGQDQKIIGQLDELSNQLGDLEAVVQAENEENSAAWASWFSSQMRVPIDQLSLELQSYVRLKNPNKDQQKQHFKKVTEIYESFSGPITEGETYGNPVALQLVIAVLAEERAGEISEPVHPRPPDGAIVAHRLQVLINRLATLNAMLDPAKPGAIAYLLRTNLSTVHSLEPQLDYVDSHYVNKELPWFANVSHQGTNSPTAYCTSTTTVTHMAYVTGDKEHGYTLTDHVQTPVTQQNGCQQHISCIHGACKTTEDSPTHEPLPGVPPQTDSSGQANVDWVSNVAKYQTAATQYRAAKKAVDRLQPVQESLAAAVLSLDQKFKIVHDTCKTLGNIQCDGDTPHMLSAR